MREITIDLEDVFHAEHINKETLQKVEHDLTEEDHDWYNTHGWKYFRPENHIDYLLPELGETIYLRGSCNPVVEINGKRWKLFFDFDWNHEAYEAKGKRVIFRETDEPLTVSDCKPSKNRHDFYMKVFGQPVWVQGEHYIAYKGKPCSHLVTIEVGWGDCGNYNILIGCNEQGDPEVAYFEASCC
jgi:hypothetical protein